MDTCFMPSRAHTPALDFSWIEEIRHEATLAEDIDFYALFSLVREKFATCYFFESLALPRHQDRYHVIGFDPIAVFTARGRSLKVGAEDSVLEKITGRTAQAAVTFDDVNPYTLLKESFPAHLAGLTHQGGLIGYFCHEAVNYFEETINLPEHDSFDTFKLGLYLDGLIYDTTTNVLSYYSRGADRSALVRECLADMPGRKVPDRVDSVRFLGHSSTKEQYIAAVERTRRKIIEGYSFQAEVGFKSNFTIAGDKIAIYDKLRRINPGPYMYYLKFGAQELMGASPEILVSSKQGIVLTTPTAGTIARGADAAEDTMLARRLLSDPKEIAEHNMLVDLHRNDVARVSRPGTVRVQDLMFIIKFSHVQHIVSLVTGELSPDKTAFDVLASLLPGGVTTGAPKIETVRIIAENENAPRGPYGGAVGRFSFNGDCDFCLPIRSIFCHGDNCYAQTSAGIVYDSVAEKEYAEVNKKLAAMMQALTELGAKIHD